MVRAVHLEVVSSMDTDACVTAIRRFIARRGQPLTILSDKGTNFVGAKREFEEFFRKLDQSSIQDKLRIRGIQWSMNPPAAPHFSGSWERMVRSCKIGMYHVLKNQKLTDDVSQTVTFIVEQMLIARPRTAVSGDVKDCEALTPNHFLIGRPAKDYPIYLQTGKTVNNRRALNASEQFCNSIWKRWMEEYLSQLQQRSKWKSASGKEPRLGDVVWILDNYPKRCQYPMGVITKVFPGDDGHVCSAYVRTAKGEFHRPAVKLVPLLEDECVFGAKNRASYVDADA